MRPKIAILASNLPGPRRPRVGGARILPLFAIFVIILLAGCRSVTTVYEYSDDGKTVVKKIITDESAVKTVMDEMKNKNVAWGTYGWDAKIKATFTGESTFMPVIEMEARDGNYWHISFLPEVDPANAIRSIMSVGVKLQSGSTTLGSTVPESVSSVKSVSAEKKTR